MKKPTKKQPTHRKQLTKAKTSDVVRNTIVDALAAVDQYPCRGALSIVLQSDGQLRVFSNLENNVLEIAGALEAVKMRTLFPPERKTQ